MRCKWDSPLDTRGQLTDVKLKFSSPKYIYLQLSMEPDLRSDLRRRRNVWIWAKFRKQFLHCRQTSFSALGVMFFQYRNAVVHVYTLVWFL